MLYRSLLSSVLVLAGAPAFAQTADWSGWHAGVHGVGAFSKVDPGFSDASRFCHTGTSSTGTGAAEGTCNVTDTFVGTSATAVISDGFGGTAAAGASAANTNGGAAAGASATTPPPVAAAIALEPAGAGPSAGSGTAAANDAVNGGAVSQVSSGAASAGLATSLSRVKSVNDAGTAEVVSLAMLNAFDLGSGGNIDQSQFGLGAHIGYLHQYRNGLVFGIEADITALLGGRKTISETAAFNPLSGFDASSGAVASMDDDVLPFASASSTTESAYSQSISTDTRLLSSVRAKLGLARNNFFPYLTAGAALAHYSVNARSTLNMSAADLNAESGVSLSSARNSNETAIGGVVGGGVSMAFENFIVSAEGLYYIFNDKVDVGSGFLNTGQSNTVTFDNVAEVRLKISIPLN